MGGILVGSLVLVFAECCGGVEVGDYLEGVHGKENLPSSFVAVNWGGREVGEGEGGGRVRGV